MNTKSLNIFIYTFAIIGLVSILSSFNNQPENQQSCSTVPESHVWEFHLNNPAAQGQDAMAFAINKVTGEVRKYETNYSFIKGMDSFGGYSKAIEQ